MSDDEIIEIIAPFMGLVRHGKNRWHRKGVLIDPCTPDYPNSRDELAPVLAKFNEDQWTRLHERIKTLWADDIKDTSEPIRRLNFMRFVLMLPPRTLALAVASVLKEGR